MTYVKQSTLICYIYGSTDLAFTAFRPSLLDIFTAGKSHIGPLDRITQRHGAFYAKQLGWDASFEKLVGEICRDFERHFDPLRERCWIAEMTGERVGSIALARSEEDGVAKLRLLLLEEQARGCGLGSHLVDVCHQFARHAGYKKMRLWTTDQQKEAREIYRGKGYVLVAEEPVHAFGKDMVDETWELIL